MRVDQALVEAAIALAESRYAGDPDGDGWAGAAQGGAGALLGG